MLCNISKLVWITFFYLILKSYAVTFFRLLSCCTSGRNVEIPFSFAVILKVILLLSKVFGEVGKHFLSFSCRKSGWFLVASFLDV